MPVETVQVEWVRDQVFLMADRFGFPLVMTQPAGVNGADLLPLSVIGCAVWDIVAILRKQRQPLTSLVATADSHRDEEPPWRFRKIHIRYRFGGRGLNRDKIARAIDLTHSRYCATYATVREAVELSSEFEIWEQEDVAGLGAGPAAGVAVQPSASLRPADVVRRFNDALNARDVDGMMRLMTEDCVFENTFPPPNGARYEGRPAVRAFWEAFFRGTRDPRIEIEELWAADDRCVMRWIYRWVDNQGAPGHVRGVDLYRIRDGLIAEKLSYVKG